MDPFDPVINYGPNDAGASALTITLVVLAIIIASFLFGALSSLISNTFDKDKNKK